MNCRIPGVGSICLLLLALTVVGATGAVVLSSEETSVLRGGCQSLRCIHTMCPGYEETCRRFPIGSPGLDECHPLVPQYDCYNNEVWSELINACSDNPLYPDNLPCFIGIIPEAYDCGGKRRCWCEEDFYFVLRCTRDLAQPGGYMFLGTCKQPWEL
jgi:hypothetical protein